MIMNAKLPLTSRMQSAFREYLLLMKYNIFQADKIIDFINNNPSHFRIVRHTRIIAGRRFYFWHTYFHGKLIFTESLLTFIKNDCLPF